MQNGQPEASTILVESIPVEKGTKLSKMLSNDDAIGLGWLLYEGE